ncbi:cupin domain-containing protein [Nocardia sp. NPDC051787]|uniref:cupin domain-containing protein n=1 Tax=Nocardia sp. NPDC051787 TaxID=3155415 RepID=UPI00344128AC
MSAALGMPSGVTSTGASAARRAVLSRRIRWLVAATIRVGNIYTILIPGSATNGRYTLIDMRVPPGGGPPPHRHDFEEMFTVVEGRIRFTFRGTDIDVVAGATVNIPANAPHFFRNVSDVPARMLCMCTPAGQEEYFAEIGAVLDSPTDTPPPLTEAEESQQREKARQLAAKYRSELV